MNVLSGAALSDVQWAQLQLRQPADHVHAVITTGIACRPGCPARTPLRKNVRVFASLSAAIEAGYRPCKRCWPKAATPESLQSA